MTKKTVLRNTPERSLRMLDALNSGPKTYDQLVLASGLKKPAVAHWVKAMRAAGGVYVAGWAEDQRGRLFMPVFARGSGSDVQRPGPAKSAAERMRRMRDRRKNAAPSEGIGLDDLL